MDKEFLFVDHNVENNVTQFKQCDGRILVKHFSGGNNEVFIVKKYDGKQMEFSFIKLHGIYYVIVNGRHMVDYKKFARGIQSVVNSGDDVCIKNMYEGDIIVQSCDVEVVQKALQVMSEWFKKRNKWWHDILYFILH